MVGFNIIGKLLLAQNPILAGVGYPHTRVYIINTNSLRGWIRRGVSFSCRLPRSGLVGKVSLRDS